MPTDVQPLTDAEIAAHHAMLPLDKQMYRRALEGNRRWNAARELLRELAQVMADYEMEVDEPPPYRHRELMRRARALLEGTDHA